MKTSTKIILVAILGVLVITLTMLPGIFPFRAFEPVFAGVCTRFIDGEVTKYNNTDFEGVAGLMVRQDSIVCGIDRSYDGDEVCYVAPQSGSAISSGVDESADECASCQYSWDYLKSGRKVLGKSCRPFRFIWRWRYKTPF